MELVLIRHGETKYNREDLFRGRADLDLNDQGLMQARAAALGADVGGPAAAARTWPHSALTRRRPFIAAFRRVPTGSNLTEATAATILRVATTEASNSVEGQRPSRIARPLFTECTGVL